MKGVQRAPYVPANSSFQKCFNLYIISSNYKRTEGGAAFQKFESVSSLLGFRTAPYNFQTKKKIKKERVSKIRMK